MQILLELYTDIYRRSLPQALPSKYSVGPILNLLIYVLRLLSSKGDLLPHPATQLCHIKETVLKQPQPAPGWLHQKSMRLSILGL